MLSEIQQSSLAGKGEGPDWPMAKSNRYQCELKIMWKDLSYLGSSCLAKMNFTF